jgi:gamma-glutamylcyclotransferase (GGCT)/AIG2-like uncharacterized protein YtfP
MHVLNDKLMDENLVFVYGTLMAGNPLHGALGDSEFVGQALVSGTLFDTGYYPALTPPVLDGDRVRGEVYDVDDATLAVLDRCEGVNARHPDLGLYKRVERMAVLVEGNTGNDEQVALDQALVWVYEYARPVDGLELVLQRDGAYTWLSERYPLDDLAELTK